MTEPQTNEEFWKSQARLWERSLWLLVGGAALMDVSDLIKGWLNDWPGGILLAAGLALVVLGMERLIQAARRERSRKLD